jgi:hypothetical protein
MPQSVLSGFLAAAVPPDILKDSGVLYVGNNPMGVSRGGLTFDPKKEIRNVDFDGKKSPVMGLDRVSKHAPVFSGTMLEFDNTDVGFYEPGITDGVTGVATGVMTPIDAGQLFVAGNYLTNLRLIFARANDSGYVQIRFPRALCTKYSLVGKDSEEPEVSCEFEARLDMSVSGADLGDAPYVIEYLATLP